MVALCSGRISIALENEHAESRTLLADVSALASYTRGHPRLAEKDALKGSHLAEENVLPAGDNDFPSIWK
jgi:hypothetical protein